MTKWAEPGQPNDKSEKETNSLRKANTVRTNNRAKHVTATGLFENRTHSLASNNRSLEVPHAEYDLHLHSYWSYDACASVEAYFRLAKTNSARAIAITEHFTMDSIPEILETANNYPDVRFIAGAEMTVDTSRGPIDMLCLGLPLKTNPELEAVFEQYRRWQHLTGNIQGEQMRKAGYEFGTDERLRLLRVYRPEYVIKKQGVTHVSAYLLRQEFKTKGYINTEDDFSAFMYKICNGKPCPKYPPAEAVLPIMKKYGGVVFIAHPFRYFEEYSLNTMDALREELAFDGIECAHPMIPAGLSPLYRDYCIKHKLLSSAGSDCHAAPEQANMNFSPKSQFLGHAGSVRWLDEISERVLLH